MWWSSKSISSDTYQERRTWRIKISLGPKKDPNQIEVFRFIRLVFGLVQSLFALEETIDELLSSYTEKYPAEVDKIRNGLYVDDLIVVGKSFEQVASLKHIELKIFCKVDFKLHNWNLNVPYLGRENW